MFARCLVLIGLIAPCAALNVKVAKPIQMMKDQNTCALTFAAHSGFGNQLHGALGAAYIAKLTGCKLVLPPVLTHGDVSYGKIEECQKGLKFEKTTLNNVAPYYKKSNLTWTQIFNLNTKIASTESLKVDPRQLHFLPVTCGLWKEQGQDEAKVAKYLKDFIQKTDPKGSYTMGSGFAFALQSGAPRLDFNELFESLSGNLDQAVSDSQDAIAKLGKAKKGDYACVHLRSRDIFMTQAMQDKPLKEWVSNNLNNIGSKPLLVISANLRQNVEDVMKDVCTKQETECIDGNSIMPAGDYGFPETGNRLKSNKNLLIELATCAMASDVYLPNSEKKIIKGKEVVAKEEHIFQSTLSDVIATMALHKKK